MKKNKLKMYGIFSALAVAILLLFCLGMICARKISWEGDYFVDEYMYDENGEGSYRRQVIELHIEEAEVPKQSENTQISFSMPPFPDSEEMIYVVLERNAKDGVRIKYSFRETELEEIPFMQLERR